MKYLAKNLTKEQIIDLLESLLSPKRVKHIRGVIYTAQSLNELYTLNIEPEKVFLAAAFHDIAKEKNNEELLELAEQYKYTPNKTEKEVPHLLHARIGRYIAEFEYGITEEDILLAIENHTFGNADMSSLEEIIFLADAIEPSRDPKYSQPIIDSLHTSEIKGAIYTICKNTLASLREYNAPIHPQMEITYSYYKQYMQ